VCGQCLDVLLTQPNQCDWCSTGNNANDGVCQPTDGECVVESEKIKFGSMCPVVRILYFDLLLD